MKQRFSASIWREGDGFVAQCREVDMASQGETAESALANLREALTLHSEEPRATEMPDVRTLEIEVNTT